MQQHVRSTCKGTKQDSRYHAYLYLFSLVPTYRSVYHQRWNQEVVTSQKIVTTKISSFFERDDLERYE